MLKQIHRSFSRRSFIGGTLAAGLASPFQAFSAERSNKRIVLLGDCELTRSLPRGSADVEKIRPWLADAAVTIGNFEGTLAGDDAWPSLVNPGGKTVCGGMNVRGDDKVLEDLQHLGVDMVGTGNNHSLDWGIGGMLETLRKLDAAGIAHTGSGIDLPTARAPVYRDTTIGRVALISFTSTYWSGALASRPNGATRGRPGVSPLRYLKSDQAADSTWPNPDDLAEITASIKVAAANADHVVVSGHTHEGEGDTPPGFQRRTARACIDAGATIFFGHGPHKLRGMEAYRGTPIFYSLGAFIFRNRPPYPLPSELFEGCQINSQNSQDYYAKMVADYGSDVPFWQSVIVSFSPAEKKVYLVPIVIHHAYSDDYGTPMIVSGAEAISVFERIQRLSKPYGVRIDVKNGIGEWQL